MITSYHSYSYCYIAHLSLRLVLAGVAGLWILTKSLAGEPRNACLGARRFRHLELLQGLWDSRPNTS